MRILVVEDEKKIAAFLKKGLEEENFSVDVVNDGKDAEEFAKMIDYDCILLDILLPSVNGIQICRKLRDSNITSPVMLITALNSTQDKVLGLDSGADDYLSKPFDFDELLARVRALIRRKSGAIESVLKVNDLVMHFTKRKVFRGDLEIELTNKEFSVLEYLMRNHKNVVTRRALLEHVWAYTYDTGSNVVDVHINLLRNKVDKGFDKHIIKTVRGAGYKLDFE